MTKFLTILLVILVTGCNNAKQETPAKQSDLVIMTPQGMNQARMNDTLVIYEKVCRGCAYEESTHFEIEDSLNLVKIVKIETIDNNSPDMDGGSIDKHIFLAPVKPGETKLKLFKFNTETPSTEDSLVFTYYKIKIIN